ncbi:ferritin-like domain-containing protein [Pendulispora albinea]|uniref:Ferritin-like domain-containing protein n=1 Tax=Pendulispora albinea TaxID=2741071 RepID=A0ABZ2LSY3_9BACT
MANVPSSADASFFTAPTVYARIAQESAKPAKEGPQGVEKVDVAFPMSYTWDYATSRLDLRVLYEKSKDLMWNGSTDLPWETPVDPESQYVPDNMNPLFGTPIWDKLDKKREVPTLRRHMASYMISNFLHGEQGALLATSQIVNCAPTSEAKFYAAAQVFDEARHVEVYDRYLREKYELVYPISPHLKKLLDTLLQDSRWDFKYLGMQIMVEGVALGAFGFIHQTTEEPLIRQITQMIMQDESRHVAFGVLALKDTYADMAPSELRDREDFVIEASRLLRDKFLGQEVWERLGLPQKECEEYSERSESMQFFRKLLFTKIVPNVKRLGLLTPYVRRGFEELEVIDYENWEPSA